MLRKSVYEGIYEKCIGTGIIKLYFLTCLIPIYFNAQFLYKNHKDFIIEIKVNVLIYYTSKYII